MTDNVIIDMMLIVELAGEDGEIAIASFATEEHGGMLLGKYQEATMIVASMKSTNRPLKFIQYAERLNELLGMGASQSEIILSFSEILTREDKFKNDFPKLFS